MSINEYRADKKFASIIEIKDETLEQRNEIRLYKSSPEGFTIQIRTFKGIGENKPGTPRKMIASAYVTTEEVEAMLRFMKAEDA